MVRWIVLVFCSIGLLITGCDGSNCANPNPDYDPTDPTSESCLVACEAGTYRCSQSNLERCKDAISWTQRFGRPSRNFVPCP